MALSEGQKDKTKDTIIKVCIVLIKLRNRFRGEKGNLRVEKYEDQERKDVFMRAEIIGFQVMTINLSNLSSYRMKRSG